MIESNDICQYCKYKAVTAKQGESPCSYCDRQDIWFSGIPVQPIEDEKQMKCNYCDCKTRATWFRETAHPYGNSLKKVYYCTDHKYRSVNKGIRKEDEFKSVVR